MVTARLPVPFKRPPVRFRVFNEAGPPILRLPAETLSTPEVPPFNTPFSAALPVPETVRAPPSVVVPDTVSDPPEILSELVGLIVNAAMLSTPTV